MSLDDDRRLTISKLQAAKSQLDCAIGLWVSDKDAVSIHTLAGAAHEIIADIIKKHGKPHPLFDADFIKDDHREEFRRVMRRHISFFKHANRDPHDVIEFTPVTSIIYLLLSLHMLRMLGETLSDVQACFHLWLFVHKPNWINDEVVKLMASAIPLETHAQLRTLSKKEFFDMALKAAGLSRAASL